MSAQFLSGRISYNAILIFRVEKRTEVQDEPNFNVFYTFLLSIFRVFCFKCKGDLPEVRLKKKWSSAWSLLNNNVLYKMLGQLHME